VQAPRNEPAVLIADLDIDQRRDWLALFPLLATRRPDAYGLLTAAKEQWRTASDTAEP
jgi:N-carbamoylputrescine amidase